MGKGATRRRKTPSALRKVLADNVLARGKARFPDAPNIPLAICVASGTGDAKLVKSTVQRILAEETSATLEQLDSLAKALKTDPQSLLISPEQMANWRDDAEDFYRAYQSLGPAQRQIIEITLQTAVQSGAVRKRRG